MYDILIQGGRVLDPSQGLNHDRDVALADGQVKSIAETIAPDKARQVIDARGMIVTPGLIDIHVHVYEGVSHYGVHADRNCLHRGVTTAIDAGSSGAGTFPGLRKYIIEVSETRILAYLNLSKIGMITECPPGELDEIRYADTHEAMQTLEANTDVLLGIKVRMDQDMVGDNSHEVLKRAREVSDAARLPLMVHIGNTVPSLPKVLAELRSGDVITHCFHDKPGGVLDDHGRVLPEVQAVYEKGVYFDVGHGRGSFSFEVARKALKQGLPPSTISSDLHTHNLHGPVFDLATTMSKFLYLGLSLPEVIEMTTTVPARSIRMEDQIGTLQPGACADVTILKLQEGSFKLTDASKTAERETVTTEQILSPTGVIRGGKLIFMHDSE